MKRTFTINGKEYEAVKFGINTICDMEEIGVSITDLKGKNFAALRAYLALCMKKRKDVAGDELESHVINGGSLEELGEIMGKEVEESGFFQALSEESEKNTPSEKKKE